jgi:alpha-galactosidase
MAGPEPSSRGTIAEDDFAVKFAQRLRVALLLPIIATNSNAFGAQTDISISTASAPATPRILGPTLVGSIPGSPFLYAVPATGQLPLTFTASGLPSGLSIDVSSGTISGTTPAAGSYSISIAVSNGLGSASATMTLTAGSTLALTPPMGWNSYDSFGADVKESEVLAAAKAMKATIAPYGWNTVVIDYLWYDPEQTIDENGRWSPSSTKYPSAAGATGFKAIADQVHALGLSFGIHLMRGIPRKSFTANTPIANSTYTASQAGNSGDTCSWDSHMYGVRGDTDAGKAWYDSIYSQYAAWGVDFVKVDDMMNPYGGNALHTAEVQAVAASIAKTGRSMILSLSPGPNQPKDVAILNANANMWRTVNDFWDTNGLSNISDEFTAAYNWSVANGITPGHWPDADMLPLGTIGSRACAFSHNQQVMVMTLWAIMPSPLIFGGQPTKLASDTWTLALLTNEEVLAVNQDALGSRGKRVAQKGNTEVWSKDLSGGRKAVALFNRGTDDATVSATFAQLGVSGTPAVRDLWHRMDVTGVASQISVNVPHESALIYTLTPAGGGTGETSGTGGAGGASSVAGGTSGRGGSVSGGAAGTATQPTTGGTPETGGTTSQGGATRGTLSTSGHTSTGGRASSGGEPAGLGGSSQSATGGTMPGTGMTSLATTGGQLGSLGAVTAGGGQTQLKTSASKASTVESNAGTASGMIGTNVSTASKDSGCSCAVPSSRGSAAEWLVASALALLTVRRRRDRH